MMNISDQTSIYITTYITMFLYKLISLITASLHYVKGKINISYKSHLTPVEGGAAGAADKAPAVLSMSCAVNCQIIVVTVHLTDCITLVPQMQN